MRWAILLGSPDISGGTYVIFQHAISALKKGIDVVILTEGVVTFDRLNWFPEAKNLIWKTYSEVQNDKFDVVIATWWKTVYELYRINAQRYIYFIQSIESKFYPEYEKPLRHLVEATYTLPLYFITEASWIKKYLKENYNQDAKLVLNGIRKDIYSPTGESWGKKNPEKLRLLVEGPVDVAFKNVAKTIELCRRSLADEIWLMTSSPIHSYPGVDRVFSRVPMNETCKVYRSCDAIVKLSYVEGMFGPPLEMFHCGGTSITYDVTGYDEYIVPGENGIVIKTDDEKAVVENINYLKQQPALLENLKKNAYKTAQKWLDWDESSKCFMDSIMDYIDTKEPQDKNIIEILSKFEFQSYEIAEQYRLQLSTAKSDKLKAIKNCLRENHPRIFMFLKRIHIILITKKISK